MEGHIVTEAENRNNDAYYGSYGHTKCGTGPYTGNVGERGADNWIGQFGRLNWTSVSSTRTLVQDQN